MELLKEEARRTPHPGHTNIQKINYRYRRFHPTYGIQHIMQVTVKTEKKPRNGKNGTTKQHNRWFHSLLPFGNRLYSS